MFYIKELNLMNFRCYDQKKMAFSPKINIIYGDNASGKTSILESIGFLGILKSFRDAKDMDMIKANEPYFFIKGVFIDEDEEKSIDVIASYDKNSKKIKKNNILYSKNSEYIGYLNIVSFSPDNIDIVKSSPSVRRKFLNVYLSQIDREYMLSLIKYNKILKTRNEYLKNELYIDEIYLDAITNLLCNEAKIIIRKRIQFIDNINAILKSVSLRLTKEKEIVQIKYLPNIDADCIENQYNDKKNQDISLKTTTIGPHRDDFLVIINNQDANIYASCGQIKTAVIAIKLSIAEFMKKTNKRQIILLDDVFSELDKARQNDLLTILDKDNQIFITSTTINNIDQAILERSNIIKFTKGI